MFWEDRSVDMLSYTTSLTYSVEMLVSGLHVPLFSYAPVVTVTVVI